MEMYKGYWEQRRFGLEMAKDLMRGFEGERREPRRRGLVVQALAELVSWLAAIGA